VKHPPGLDDETMLKIRRVATLFLDARAVRVLWQRIESAMMKAMDEAIEGLQATHMMEALDGATIDAGGALVAFSHKDGNDKLAINPILFTLYQIGDEPDERVAISMTEREPDVVELFADFIGPIVRMEYDNPAEAVRDRIGHCKEIWDRLMLTDAD